MCRLMSFIYPIAYIRSHSTLEYMYMHSHSVRPFPPIIRPVSWPKSLCFYAKGRRSEEIEYLCRFDCPIHMHTFTDISKDTYVSKFTYGVM